MDYISIHNYRPNVIARSLAQSQTFNIAVVLPNDLDIAEKPFFLILIMGILEVANIHEYDVVIVVEKGQNDSEVKRLVTNGKIDGAIVTKVRENGDATVDFLKQSELPYIVTGTMHDHMVPQIDTDHKAACRELTTYLLGNDVENLPVALMVGDLRHTVDIMRRDGFLSAFDDDLFSRKKQYYIYDKMDARLKIERAFEESIRKGVKCFLCGDDMLCEWLLSVINESGYSIPEDLKVASFYDSSALRNNNPPITAIQVDGKLLGQQTCQLLLDSVEKNQEVIPMKTVFNYTLVVRKSTQVKVQHI